MQIGPGTRVLVTGASRGIGEAIARGFAARGCTLGLVARRREPLEKLAEELPGEGHAAIPADVTDADTMAAAVEQFGHVDVVVANAGITHYRPFAQLPLDEARHMNDVNWLGTIHTVWAALPGMIDRRRGHIVVISSGGGVRGFPSAAVYNGTKAAQRGFAEALRHELDGTGVSVTTVFPGRSRPPSTTTSSTTCRTGTGSTAVRRRARSDSRWWRPWRTTSASCSTRRSCGCCGW